MGDRSYKCHPASSHGITNGDWDAYWEAHIQREKTLINQRMSDGIGYPDDYGTDVEDSYLH